jgi:hypothetical protein
VGLFSKKFTVTILKLFFRDYDDGRNTVFFAFIFQNFSGEYKNGQKKCPIFENPKKFCEFYYVFFDVTEKREYNYYFLYYMHI